MERLLTIYRACQKRKREFLRVLNGALSAKVADSVTMNSVNVS